MPPLQPWACGIGLWPLMWLFPVQPSARGLGSDLLITFCGQLILGPEGATVDDC